VSLLTEVGHNRSFVGGNDPAGVSQGLHAESLGAFVFGESSPDPVWFGDFQCVIQAVLAHGVGLADLLGVSDAVFPGWFPFVRGWKNVVLAMPRQAAASCQSQWVSWGPGNRRVSATVGLSILRKNRPRVSW
jgi:hypothetical protein